MLDYKIHHWKHWKIVPNFSPMLINWAISVTNEWFSVNSAAKSIDWWDFQTFYPAKKQPQKQLYDPLRYNTDKCRSKGWLK